MELMGINSSTIYNGISTYRYECSAERLSENTRACFDYNRTNTIFALELQLSRARLSTSDGKRSRLLLLKLSLSACAVVSEQCAVKT